MNTLRLSLNAVMWSSILIQFNSVSHNPYRKRDFVTPKPLNNISDRKYNLIPSNILIVTFFQDMQITVNFGSSKKIEDEVGLLTSKKITPFPTLPHCFHKLQLLPSVLHVLLIEPRIKSLLKFRELNKKSIHNKRFSHWWPDLLCNLLLIRNILYCQPG